jgi:cobalt-zinc-cadmium efflux system protein
MSHGHHHGHHHAHGHHHGHSPQTYSRAFAISAVLNLGIVVLQVAYGFLGNSLALLADAGHNLTDVFSLLLAWGASQLGQRPPTQRYTYGLRRTSILAALVNAVLLLLMMGAIAWEAIHRLGNPSRIAEVPVIVVALVAIAVNGGSALLFRSGRSHDLNLRGAFLHLLTDAFVSLGVVLSAIASLLTGWHWFDPVMSLVIVITIVIGTWQLLRDSLNLALDGVPESIEPLAVRTYLQDQPGVVEVHDLHIWAMSTTETALTAHLVIPSGHPGDRFLAELCHSLHDKFGIEHTTLQVETGHPDYPCNWASDAQV